MNILISGVTCSGKTTMANKIKDLNPDTCIMPQDSYFKDLKDIPSYRGRYLMDSLNAFEYNEYYNDAQSLLENNQVVIPNYDIDSNKRISKDILLLKKELVVFEGLHTIRILSEAFKSLKIFLLIDLEECLRRRIERDSEKYHVSKKLIEDYFRECVLPMYHEYIYPQRKNADVVMEEGDDLKWVLKKYIQN